MEAAEAALALGEQTRVEEIVATIEGIPAGRRPPYLDAQSHRFKARLAGADESAQEEYAAAAVGFRDLGIVFFAGGVAAGAGGVARRPRQAG